MWNSSYSAKEIFLKTSHSRPHFSLFLTFLNNNWLKIVHWFCCWDSNREPLVSEATTLATEPPLRLCNVFLPNQFSSRQPHFHSRSSKPKIKLYRDSNGVPKGDALCTYAKVESVQLALTILDGSTYHGKVRIGCFWTSSWLKGTNFRTGECLRILSLTKLSLVGTASDDRPTMRTSGWHLRT